MLEAKKSRWFEEIFAVYNRNLLKRRFNSFRASGLEFLQNQKQPLLIYANHSSWWDGLIAFEISRKLNLDSFVMMEEKHLEKLFLFRRLGAFSVVRENPREAVKSLNYAANLLKEKSPHRALWIFPQGEIVPNDKRPLNFYHGISRIIEKSSGVSVVPAAIRYDFLSEFKPEIIVKIGAPQTISFDKNFDAKVLTKQLEKQLIETLDTLKTDVLNTDLQNFENILT